MSDSEQETIEKVAREHTEEQIFKMFYTGQINEYISDHAVKIRRKVANENVEAL